MSSLRLAKDLVLPPEAATEKLGFIGRTGSGKTYAGQLLAEQLYVMGVQLVALDPVGKWWSLRLAADGKSPGLSIPVFGGLHGDIPLEPTAGKMIADVIVDRGISAVVDVSQFESDAAKGRFVSDFGDRLFWRKKAAPSPLHVFIEEAQEFVPQNPGKDDKLMLHHWTRIQKLGRNFGIGTSLLTQRPQEVNKKVLNQTEVLFVFQLTGTHERKAVEAWIGDKGLDEDIAAELPKLEQGKPHVWSPALLQISRVVAINPKKTFDASATPKVGSRAEVKELAPIDLVKLRQDMAKTIERAKAEDPKELKRTIAEKDKRIRELERAKPAPVQTSARVQEKRVEVAVLKEGQLARAESLIARHHEAVKENLAAEHELERIRADRWVASQQKVFEAIGELTMAIRAVSGNGHRPGVSLQRPVAATAPGSRIAPQSQRPLPETRAEKRKAEPVDAGEISSTARRILDTIAMLEVRGLTPHRDMVARWQNLHPNGGRFGRDLAALRAGGLLNDLTLTAEGRELVREIPSGEDAALAALPEESTRNIVRWLMEVPGSVTRDDLAGGLGLHPNGGRYGRGLAWLRVMGLIPERGDIHLTEAFVR